MSSTVVVRVIGSLPRGYLAYVRKLCKTEKPTITDHFWALVVVFFALSPVCLLASGVWDALQFGHMTPAEHMAKAREFCGPTAYCVDNQSAIHHLEAVPASAPEHAEALQLLEQVRKQIIADANNSDRARQQMIRNFNGEAHDLYGCAMSTTNEPIVSFDGNQTWWKDDGRCAARLQKKRDADAQLNSYWSTTLRVDTDMNSSWLQDEERTCQTYPDAKGKVSSVQCSSSIREAATHNIPVTFWGGVERNTISDWKCSREKSLFYDRFVCRAID